MTLLEIKDDALRDETPEWDFANPPTDPIELANSLIETMRAMRGYGLSANQVGLPYRVFVMDADPAFVCFNPKIVDVSEEKVMMQEGCLSFPGQAMRILRPKHIKVRFTTPTGEVVTKKFTGMTARCFQHEYDHLCGITFHERASFIELEKAKKKKQKHERKHAKLRAELKKIKQYYSNQESK